MVDTTNPLEDRIVELAQRAAIEAVKAMAKGNGGMTAKAGTVTDVGTELTPTAVGDPVVNQTLVVPDGTDHPVAADSVTTHPIRPGDRVYMLHVPPHAFVIIGRIRVSEEVDDVAPLEGLIVQDTPGSMSFFDPDGKLIGRQTTSEWAMGDLDPLGRRLTVDPVGGIRFRSADDVLLHELSQSGLSLRDEQTGLVVAQLTGGDSGSFRLIDPVGTDDIELVTSSLGTLPNPKYIGLPETAPGASIVAPAAPLFTTSPPDDYELYHAAAFHPSLSQAASWTVPAGTTSRGGTTHNTGTATLATSVAERDVASGVAGTHTSSQTNWGQGLGTHVVVRGGGATSPSFRSIVGQDYAPTGATSISISLPKPAGLVQGDAMVAFISMGNVGGSVPTGWTTPEGWEFLGANIALVPGPPQSCLAVGAWAKLATASEPSDYSLTISFGAGSKRLHALVVAIQNPDLIAGGAHIRIAGHPIRRLLAQTELTVASATLCDFQNIPAGYDHLEFVYTAISDTGADQLRNLRMRFNADAAAPNYHWLVDRQGAFTQSLGTDRILAGRLNGANAGHTSGGRFNIYDYAHTGAERMVLGETFDITSGSLNWESNRSLWRNTTVAINRLSYVIDLGTTKFDVGSRAFLYGY